MQNPKPTLNYKFKKPRASQVVMAFGTGLAFAGIDYLGHLIHTIYLKFTGNQKYYEVGNQIQPQPTTKFEYDKQKLTKTIQQQYNSEPEKVQRNKEIKLLIEKQDQMIMEARVLGNFFYGTIIVKLGKELRNIFLNKSFKRIKMNTKIIMTYPFPILGYYSFFNFYNGRDFQELNQRMIKDFLLLWSIRVILGTFERKSMKKFETQASLIKQNFEKTPLNFQKQMDHLIKMTTFKRNFMSSVWIYCLTYLYEYPPYLFQYPYSQFLQ